MKARILEKSEEEVWGKFLQTHPLATIHQSPAWGHFREKIPERGKYWIVVLEEDLNSQLHSSTPKPSAEILQKSRQKTEIHAIHSAEQRSLSARSGTRILGGTMLIRHCLPKGFCWLYAARGPLINYSSKNSKSQMDAIINAVKPIAKKEKAIFLRIDPPLMLFPRTQESMPPKFKHFHTAHSGFQPEHTLIIDLTKSEDEILAQMKPKGRYNIRLAEKKGVRIRETNPENKENFNKDINAFYDLLKETTERDGFHGHGGDFYGTMLSRLIPAKNAALYLAEYQSKTIAGIIITFFKDTAVYYYGASGNEYRNVMAPYLLQWHAIKEARHRHLKYYDFLGIAPSGSKNHPWQGVTQFKLKFGGEKISYIPPREFAFKKLLYLLYRIYKWFKR